MVEGADQKAVVVEVRQAILAQEAIGPAVLVIPLEVGEVMRHLNKITGLYLAG